MKISSKLTMKGLAFTLVVAMLLTMMPMLPSIGQVDDVYAGSVEPYVTTEDYDIYANGLPIILTQGAFTTSTCIYLDNGTKGAFDAKDKLVELELAASQGTSAGGYDLSAYAIYGGAEADEVTSTSITMTGGTVSFVYGGGEQSGARVEGSTAVNISGGTVTATVLGGGHADGATVSGSTAVNISGGTVKEEVYGGGYYGAVSSGTAVNISGGTVPAVYGGGKNATGGVKGGTAVNISDGMVSSVYGGGLSSKVWSDTKVTISGGTVTGDVFGGGSDSNAEVEGTTVNISGGEITGNVYGGGKNGAVKGNTEVNISGGSVTATVYGGGYSGLVVGKTAVTISDGMVSSVYGGGLSSEVWNNTKVTISGGVVTGNVTGDGQISGKVTGTTSVAITGGSIMGSVSPQPTNESGGAGDKVYKTELVFKDANGASAAGIAITNIKTAAGYGLTGVSTNSDGKIVVYLASGTSISTVKSNSTTYKVSGAAVVVTSDGAATGDFYAVPSPTHRGGGGSSAATSNIIKTDDTKKAETANEGTVKFSPANPSKGTKVTITVDENVSYEAGTPVVKDADGKLVPVTDNGDGTFSFVMPATAITVDTPFEPIFAEKKETPPFTQSVKSKQNMKLNGKDVSLGTYNVDGYNFTKLRDLAAVLGGTESKFGVETGEGRSIILTPGQSYNPVGGELAIEDDLSGTCVVSSWTITINGIVRYLDVYNIGGNNYFKLRDLGELLDFGVDYDKDTNTALITAK